MSANLRSRDGKDLQAASFSRQGRGRRLLRDGSSHGAAVTKADLVLCRQGRWPARADRSCVVEPAVPRADGHDVGRGQVCHDPPARRRGWHRPHLKQLDEHARAHPEAFAPDRLALLDAGEARQGAQRGARGPATGRHGCARIGRPPSEDPMVAVTCRLPRSLLARLDAARGDRNRGDVVREALERWLRAERRK